jgi:RHS repeat-associated protein
VDTTGTSRNHVVFDSFGNVTSETNPGFKTRFSFTGREFDAETGNYDYRSRPYNPGSGRFMEEDAIGFSGQDFNLFRYVENSPINYTDSKGYLKGVPFPSPVKTKIPFLPPFLAPIIEPLLFPDPTAYPWEGGGEINPWTGYGYRSKAEYDAIQAELSKEQQDVLRNTNSQVARYRKHLKPDPNSCDSKQRPCLAGDIPGHLGSATYPASGLYATYVSNSLNDYLVFSRTGASASFDGNTPGTRNVWEAKLGQWYLNYDEKTIRAITPRGQSPEDNLRKKRNIEREVEEEITREGKVARQCKYIFKIACSNVDAYHWYKKKFPAETVEFKPWIKDKQKFPWLF